MDSVPLVRLYTGNVDVDVLVDIDADDADDVK